MSNILKGIKSICHIKVKLPKNFKKIPHRKIEWNDLGLHILLTGNVLIIIGRTSTKEKNNVSYDDMKYPNDNKNQKSQ